MYLDKQGFWYDIVIGLLYLIQCAARLYGADNKNEKAVLVNLAFTVINIIFSIVVGSAALISIETLLPGTVNNCSGVSRFALQASCDSYKSRAIPRAAGIGFASALLNMYFWICSYSYYKELKGRDDNQA